MSQTTNNFTKGTNQNNIVNETVYWALDEAISNSLLIRLKEIIP